MGTFVSYGPRLTLPAPVVCEDAVIYGFLIPANLQKLTALCDRVFQIPSKSPGPGGPAVTCTPTDPYVIMTFSDVGWVGTDTTKTNINAGVTEHSVLFYVPVTIASARFTGAALFTPFIWVDNPLSLIGGREEFGYVKGFGSIRIPHGFSPSSFGLYSFGGKFSDKYWTFNKLIEVKRGNPLLLLNPADILAALTAGLTPPSAILEQLFVDWLTATARQVFLKQFRSIIDQSNDCCIQEITAAEYTIRGAPVSILLPNRYHITIQPLDSDPVVQDLGLQGNVTAGGGFTTSVNGGFRVETSFRLCKGQVLFP
jgi:hypothetical protein